MPPSLLAVPRRPDRYPAAPFVQPAQLVALTLTLVATLAGCGGVEEADELSAEEVPLGSVDGDNTAISSRNVQRNRLHQQRNDGNFITPDGRLGLKLGPASGSALQSVTLFTPSPMRVSYANGAATFDQPFRTTGAGSTLVLSGADAPSAPATIAAYNVRAAYGKPKSFVSPTSGGAAQTSTFSSYWTPQNQGLLAFDPRFAEAKPIQVASAADCAAMTPDTAAARFAPLGRFECYRLFHYQTIVYDNSIIATQAKLYAAVEAFSLSATNVLKRLPTGKVVAAKYLTDFEPVVLLSGTARYSAAALELTGTADGRLLGFTPGYVTWSATPWVPGSFGPAVPIGRLHQSTARLCRKYVRTAATANLACNDADADPHNDTEPLASVYPLAARQLMSWEGTPVDGDGIPACGYMWLSPEGSDLLCRLHVTRQGSMASEAQPDLTFESSTGMAYFVAGLSTGHLFRRLDGAPNLLRTNPEALACTDPVDRPFTPNFIGSATGFWATQDNGETGLPLVKRWPNFQFIGQLHATTAGRPFASAAQSEGLFSGGAAQSDPSIYFEVPLEDHVDRNYLAFFRMNEANLDDGASTVDVTCTDKNGNLVTTTRHNSVARPTRSADTSGNFARPANLAYRLALNGNAFFALDTPGLGGRAGQVANLAGYRGTAVFYRAGGEASVAGPDATPCARPRGCLAGSTFQRLAAELSFLSFVPNGTYRIASQPGVWDVWLQSGKLKVNVYVAGQAAPIHTWVDTVAAPVASGSDTLAAMASKWVPVGLMLDADFRVGRLYRGGKLVRAFTLPATGFRGTGTTNLLVTGPGVGSSVPAGLVVGVDELAVSQGVVRDDAYFAAAAGIDFARPDFLSQAEASALLSNYLTQEAKLDLAQVRVPAAFRPYVNNPAAFSKVVALGKALFSSRFLSTRADGTQQTVQGTSTPVTCATCHRTDRAFTDGLVKAVGAAPGPLNSPTILNRVFATRQFFDRRAANAVDQALRPITNPLEMNADLAQVRAKLASDPAADAVQLRGLFTAAFGAGDVITNQNLGLGLSAFGLTRIMMKNPAVNLTDAQRRGKLVFDVKGRCASCHNGANFTDELLHDTGVAAKPQGFKTPTLWGIAATAPYFHDGSAATLAEVVDFYDAGFSQRGDVDPEMRGLGLSAQEKSDLVAYLQSLTAPLVQ